MTGQWPSRLYLNLALHRATTGDDEDARRLLSLSMASFPKDPDRRDEIANATAYQLLGQPPHIQTQTMDAVRRAFDQKRFDVRDVEAKDFIRQLLFHIHAIQAFTALAHGSSAAARLSALKAVALKPSFALNRGVLSLISGKPFRQHAPAAEPAAHDQRPTFDERSTVYSSSGERTRQVNLPAKAQRTLCTEVIPAIEQALGTAVIRIEYLAKGLYTDSDFLKVCTDEACYVVRLAGGMGLLDNIPALQIAHAAGLKTPQVLAHDGAQSSWLVQEEIPGRPFEFARLTPEQAAKCLAELGESLRRLHRLRTDGFGRLEDSQLHTSQITFEQWLRKYEVEIEWSCLRGAIPEEVVPILTQARAYLCSTHIEHPVLCHGDLPRNVFVDGGQLTGILDWGGACGGDPACDLAAVELMIAATYREAQTIARLNSAFHRAYQLVPVDEALRRRIALYAFIIVSAWHWVEPKSAKDHEMAEFFRQQISPLAKKVEAFVLPDDHR